MRNEESMAVYGHYLLLLKWLRHLRLLRITRRPTPYRDLAPPGLLRSPPKPCDYAIVRDPTIPVRTVTKIIGSGVTMSITIFYCALIDSVISM